MRTIIKYLALISIIGCNYCPDIAVHPRDGDIRLQTKELKRELQSSSYTYRNLPMLIRSKPSYDSTFGYLQDVDYSKYDVLNITYDGAAQSRSTKGPPDFFVCINTRFKQVNCYTYFKYEDCYGGVSSGLQGRWIFVSVKVPKLPDNYEINSYGN